MMHVAFRAGKDDYLDSFGYINFPAHLDPELPVGPPKEVEKFLDSYAMGYEHSRAKVDLRNEQLKVMLTYGNMPGCNDEWFMLWHQAWGANVFAEYMED